MPVLGTAPLVSWTDCQFSDNFMPTVVENYLATCSPSSGTFYLSAGVQQQWSGSGFCMKRHVFQVCNTLANSHGPPYTGTVWWFIWQMVKFYYGLLCTWGCYCGDFKCQVQKDTKATSQNLMMNKNSCVCVSVCVCNHNIQRVRLWNVFCIFTSHLSLHSLIHFHLCIYPSVCWSIYPSLSLSLFTVLSFTQNLVWQGCH